MTDIREKQPAITIVLDGKVNIVSLSDLRVTMNDTENDLLTRCLAKAVIELSEKVGE